MPHHSGNCHHAHHTPDHSSDRTVDPQAKQTQLAIAFSLIGSFAAAECVVGLTSHSLVLVAESGHMASDGMALGLAFLATWIAQRPIGKSGWLANRQLETWAALVNSSVLGIISLGIAWAAIHRLYTPPEEIASLPMLITAGIGFVVNGFNIALLHRGSEHDLNLKAAFLHALADTLSSISVIVAAIAIAFGHWLWVDGAVSLLVAGLILVSVSPLILQSFKSLVQEQSDPPQPLASLAGDLEDSTPNP